MLNTRRGCYINFFLKISIQEGIFNIKLINMPQGTEATAIRVRIVVIFTTEANVSS